MRQIILTIIALVPLIGYSQTVVTIEDTVYVKKTNAYDSTLNADIVTLLNPDHDQYTASEVIVTADSIGATDSTFQDKGSEFDMRSYNTLYVFVNYTNNNSADANIRLLYKYESGGSDEFITDAVNTLYTKEIGSADTKKMYTFTNIPPGWVQIQTMAGDVDDGGGTKGTISINIIKQYQ